MKGSLTSRKNDKAVRQAESTGLRVKVSKEFKGTVAQIEKKMLQRLFGQIATGSFTVEFWDGSEEQYGQGSPFFKVIIRDSAYAGRLLKNPTLAFGEAYVDGAMELEGDLNDVFRLLYLNKSVLEKLNIINAGQKVASALRRGSITKQKEEVRHHYDLGNDFFALWLDPTMSYSCAYFHSPNDTLEQAQLQKIDHILKKLELKPGETLLDIGSGWGWLLIRAAQQYGVRATGITVSKEQHEKTKQRISELQLTHLAEVLLMDYRELAKTGRKFNKLVSVGMFEHVGRAHLKDYMASVRDLLEPGGLSLLHTITHTIEGEPNPWIKKYIFPGGYIPSLRETLWLLPDYDFHPLDLECLRMHYALTLDRWAEAYEKNISLVEGRYGERFGRMWRLYLRSCAASFRYSGLSIHQILFSKGLNNDLPLTREHIYTVAGQH